MFIGSQIGKFGNGRVSASDRKILEFTERFKIHHAGKGLGKISTNLRKNLEAMCVDISPIDNLLV